MQFSSHLVFIIIQIQSFPQSTYDQKLTFHTSCLYFMRHSNNWQW